MQKEESRLTFPTLYKKTNTGAIQYWKTWVDIHYPMDEVSAGILVPDGPAVGIVRTEFGQRGTDKPQITSDVVEEGKNLGRKNQTTAVQQAMLQAQQQYEKKLKSGYTYDIDLAESTDNILDGVKPMLAHVYEDHPKKIKWPAYAQPKLDGMRCIAVIKDGDVKLFTRTQKPIHTVPHIVAALESKFSKMHGEWILDGELYNHELKDDFNKLMSILKRDEVHPEHTKAQYHVYDIVIEGRGFDARSDLLALAFSTEWPRLVGTDWPIHLVDTVAVPNEEELQKYLAESLSQGYEGVMYRNPESHYEGKRSHGLLKVKTFKDDEFEVVDVEEGNGKLMGKAGAIWCLTHEGKPFKAKMKGTLDSLTDFLVNKQNYIGKKLTVKYQNYTPDKIPRFPVGIRFRETE